MRSWKKSACKSATIHVRTTQPASSYRRFGGPVRARPSASSLQLPTATGLVLTHGAGSNCQAPLLIALAETFADAGFIVLRCDLPYRQDRPYGPPGPGDGKRDRAGLKNAVAALKNLASGHVFLGGHSYGGRQASMLCAETAEKTRRKPSSWLPACSCCLILCIRRESPNSSARSIFSTCTRLLSLFKAHAIPSARSQKSSKP